VVLGGAEQRIGLNPSVIKVASRGAGCYFTSRPGALCRPLAATITATTASSFMARTEVRILRPTR
jgi:hypothetical protein